MIQLVDVSKTYRVKKGPEVKALDHGSVPDRIGSFH